MILVADAAPLIFLGKIDQLSLLRQVFGGAILVPSVVQREVLGPAVAPDEEHVLAAFLATCRIVEVRGPQSTSRSLSFADNCVLALARAEQADLILSDDRLLRRAAAVEGFDVTGTIGVLLRGRRAGLLSADAALGLLSRLVREHQFRISTAVYDAARQALAG